MRTREGVSLISLVVSHRYLSVPTKVAFLSSLRRKVRSALIIVNQTSGRRAASEEGSLPSPPSCASAIIVEIGENIGEEEQQEEKGEGGRDRAERYPANVLGNGDREISTDRITFLEVVIFPCTM